MFGWFFRSKETGARGETIPSRHDGFPDTGTLSSACPRCLFPLRRQLLSATLSQSVGEKPISPGRRDRHRRHDLRKAGAD